MRQPASVRLNIPMRFLRSVPDARKIISADGKVTLDGKPLKPVDGVPVGSPVKAGTGALAVMDLGQWQPVQGDAQHAGAGGDQHSNYPMRDGSKGRSSNCFSGLMRLTSGALEAVASRTAKPTTEWQIQYADLDRWRARHRVSGRPSRPGVRRRAHQGARRPGSR